MFRCSYCGQRLISDRDSLPLPLLFSTGLRDTGASGRNPATGRNAANLQRLFFLY